MWFNCIYGYNNPFMNFAMPFMNFAPMNNWYSPFPSIFMMNNSFSPFYNMFPMNVSTSNNVELQNTDSSISQNTENQTIESRLNKTTSVKDYSKIEQTEKESKPESETEHLVHGVKYNKQKGELLANNVVDGLPTNRDPNNPLCARYVKKAIVKSGLGPYINGNGEYCKNILRANKNFKEVKVKASELSTLPAGSVIVYDAYDTYTDDKGKQHKIGKDGHVLVALGDGRGCSDIMEDFIPKSDRAYTFIPV